MQLTALFFARSPADSNGVSTTRPLSVDRFLLPLATIRHLTASASLCVAFLVLTPPTFGQAASHSSSTGGADHPDIIFVKRSRYKVANCRKDSPPEAESFDLRKKPGDLQT